MSERRERRVAPLTLGRDVHILKAFQAPKTEDGSSLKGAFTFKKHPGKSKPSGGVIHVFTHGTRRWRAPKENSLLHKVLYAHVEAQYPGRSMLTPGRYLEPTL